MTLREKPPKKVYQLEEIRGLIRNYCVYRERSHQEVRAKLFEYGTFSKTADILVAELIEENYLNEERFAKAFVRGKFNQKKWGKQKIRQALYPHQLSDYVMKKAFEEIDEPVYLQVLESLLEAKNDALKEKNPWLRKRKLADYLIRRGYESDLVWDMIRASMP